MYMYMYMAWLHNCYCVKYIMCICASVLRAHISILFPLSFPPLPTLHMVCQYKREELLKSSSLSVGAGTHNTLQSPRAGGGGQYHLGHPREVFRHIQPLAIEQKVLRNGEECLRLQGG